VKEVVGEVFDEQEQKSTDNLMNTVLTMATELTLQKHVNKGLGDALNNEKEASDTW
jgi:hypothetical protein